MRKTFLLFAAIFFASTTLAAPANFEQAKTEARRYVYHDRTEAGTFYCGCNWEWVGRSGGRTNLQSCGYQIRSQPTRANRTEWEHIVPASSFGQLRQCWQQGGRSNCGETDPVFRAMEADMHNLTPAVGEVNADRSNYQFGVLPGTQKQHGACDFKVDFSARTAEPRDAVKGQIARIYFYIHDRYDVPMSRQQQQLMLAWHRQHPVSDWERERDRRIAARMGHSNPFVTVERTWTLGHKNSGDGLFSALPKNHPVTQKIEGVIIGNKNSKVYHLPQGCPSYNRVAEQNRIEFAIEAEAQAAGFTKAGNCR
ncbi:endonuclease [Marinospirillum sp.]|uniref:endonuclease n=1 Tax=Marinospirillum sp. TaxID=2183934 RepID=UPI0025BD2258|nr:endonuclease [Marinospirillum sp.]